MNKKFIQVQDFHKLLQTKYSYNESIKFMKKVCIGTLFHAYLH